MRYIAIALLFISAFISSCSTDFDVTANWKDITILYGLLDKSDTANYIKVGKAYLDPNTNAYEIAQNPDSLYYDDLNVVLEEYQNSALVKTIQLTKVDGNLEGYVKDTGIFALAPNILYKTKETLNQKSTYKVVVTEPDNGKQVSASAAVVDDFLIYTPTNVIPINILPNSKYTCAWVSATDGRIYALTVRFYYREYSFNNPAVYEPKYVDWVCFTNMLQEDLKGGDNMSFDLNGDNFYTFLSSAIPVDETKFRMCDHLDFFFSVGGQELDTYNQVTIAQQGLTSGQVLPTYTNVDNGLGLFSSRYHKNVTNVQIDWRTQDTIACLSVTHELNFLRSDSSLCP